MVDDSTPPSNSESIDIDGCVALYVELRDTIKQLKNELKEKLKPYNKGMADLDVVLLKALQDQKAQSIATPHGTVYQRIFRSATIRDKKAFREFIIENGMFDMLDWKANKVEVFSYMEEKAVDIPGINTSGYMTIGVMRGGELQEDDNDQ